MMPTVLVLAGLVGSGKTTAAAFFKKKKSPVARMGDVTDKLLKQLGLRYCEKNEKYVRENLRKEYGQDIYAKKVIPSILALCKTNKLVVVDGMRNKQELDLFKKNLSNPKIVFLDASRQVRYKRLLERRKRPLTLSEAKERDASELKYFKLHKLRKYADYAVDNQGKLTDLYGQLREILNKITYDQT